MNTKAKKKAPERSSGTSLNQNLEGFDFDLWATHVKRQMIASLQKRGVR
ncbi:MAG: hypothetical protein SFW36_12065 [Leptolyngbyaceae cyanobacterium bins.59]|nr:hypothetical protein [Leptolyngbyaceae cyanobacterium bins.59]